MPERPAEAEGLHPAPVGSGQGRAAQRDRAAFSRDSSPVQGGWSVQRNKAAEGGIQPTGSARATRARRGPGSPLAGGMS